ncbi:hypothetical protein V2J09_015885 [Rumex salicifolius]
MAGESDKDVNISEKSDNSPAEEKSKKEKPKKKQSGLISRIWNGIIGPRDDDFERRLERISKDESAILSRMRRRSLSWGRMRMHLILFSVLLEFIAVVYALLNARSVQNWKQRMFHVLPMFLLPAISSLTYIALVSFKQMYLYFCLKSCSIVSMAYLVNCLSDPSYNTWCLAVREHKDQKTLEELRAERQSKIDELKEKTNYYITQQLIQKYDTDPAAKAAAATVLASKLGADSGLRVYVGDDQTPPRSSGKDSDAISAHSDGLRRRKQPQCHSRSSGNSPVTLDPDPALLQQLGDEIAEHNRPVYVDHYQQEQGSSDAYSGNWLSRIAASLVGEDPTECYALICGLATKEDFPYLTYICPHCRAVNGPRKKDDHISVPSSPGVPPSLTMENISVNHSPRDGSHESVDYEHKTLGGSDKEDQAVTSEDEHN